MHDQYLEDERAWITARLSATGMTDFDRNNALAMVSRGVILGNVLSRLWLRLSGR